MSDAEDRSYQVNKARIKLGEKLVVGQLKQSFRRFFREDFKFNYPHLGRQGKIMYTNCTLDFQRAHTKAIGSEHYVSSMIPLERQNMNFSPWSSGSGFYVSRYLDFAALWSWVGDPKDSAWKNLECQGWHGELTEPLVAYARSVGKLEERLKHSGEVLACIKPIAGKNKKGVEVFNFKR